MRNGQSNGQSNGSSGRRSRGRGNSSRKSGGNQRTQVFDSNGPDVRIRGTAHQVCEKYLALAKDSASSGDRILAESYLQHAEHYQRIISAWNTENAHTDQAKPQQKKAVEDKKPVSGNVKSEDDDLSLPTSILGGDVEASSIDKRTETRTENPELLV